MSGGGRDIGIGGPVGPVDPGTSCDDLVFECFLGSPKAAAVASLYVGQLLDVELQGSLVAVLDSTQAVGSIVDRLAELLRCLRAGTAFQAEVLSISGGSIRLRVSPS